MLSKARQTPPILEAEFSQLASIHLRPRPLNRIFPHYDQWFDHRTSAPTIQLKTRLIERGDRLKEGRRSDFCLSKTTAAQNF
jgi:hypothetical protein